MGVSFHNGVVDDGDDDEWISSIDVDGLVGSRGATAQPSHVQTTQQTRPTAPMPMQTGTAVSQALPSSTPQQATPHMYTAPVNNPHLGLPTIDQTAGMSHIRDEHDFTSNNMPCTNQQPYQQPRQYTGPAAAPGMATATAQQQSNSLRQPGPNPHAYQPARYINPSHISDHQRHQAAAGGGTAQQYGSAACGLHTYAWQHNAGYTAQGGSSGNGPASAYGGVSGGGGHDADAGGHGAHTNGYGGVNGYAATTDGGAEYSNGPGYNGMGGGGMQHGMTAGGAYNAYPTDYNYQNQMDDTGGPMDRVPDPSLRAAAAGG